MAIIELKKLSLLVKENNISPENKQYLSDICFMWLTEQHDLHNLFNDQEIEFLINHTDITGVSKIYGYQWGVLHWAEQNKIVLSEITKNFLLHTADLTGTDNNGNTLLFHAVKSPSYFNSTQIDYILHHSNCNIVNILGDRALNVYLYNQYNSLEEHQLNHLFRNTSYLPTQTYNNPLRSFLIAKNTLTAEQVDLLLNMPHDWGSSYDHNQTLNENILICILKEKATDLFTTKQMHFIIENAIPNVQEALIIMTFFSRVTNLSVVAQRKLDECIELYDLMKNDPNIELPSFSEYSPNLPLSLSKNISLKASESIIMNILTKTLVILDDLYLFNEKVTTEPLMDRIKHLFFHHKSHDPVITPKHSQDDNNFRQNKKDIHNNLH